MNGGFGLLRLSEQSVALLSFGKFPGGLPRRSGCLLQPLVEGYAVLLSITLGRHERRLLALLAPVTRQECDANDDPSLTQVIPMPMN
jgi:hypothetical protein